MKETTENREKKISLHSLDEFFTEPSKRGGKMRKIYISFILLISIVPCIFSSPTIQGNKGVLRVFAADPEIYSAGKPTLFLGFYQGYAKEKEKKELHYGLNITMLIGQRFEFSYLIENLTSDFAAKPLSNDFKFKFVLFKRPFLKISPLGEFGFPISGKAGNKIYGGYLTSTLDLGAARTFLPLRLHFNIGYLVEGGANRIPILGAVVYPTKYLDIFLESGIKDMKNNTFITITPGLKAKLWGVRITSGIDFNTEGEPKNKFNFMFSWLGPFTGVKTVPEIGIGKIKGFVYDKKTTYPVTADILLEGDINRKTQSNIDGNFSVDELPPGDYTVIVNADGYKGNMKETEIHRGETQKLKIGLEPIPKIGILSGSVKDKETQEPLSSILHILPDDISFSSDSSSGNFSRELNEGNYNITVSKEGYYTVRDSFKITSDSTTERIYSLKKIEKIGTFKGKILDEETEKPLCAMIIIKERSITSDSLSGKFSIKLEEGNYSAGISKKGYSSISDTFIIKSDSTTERVYKLRKIKKKVIAFNDILFDFDKYFIKKEFFAELEKLADFLKNSPDRKIRLSGHTCSIGTDSYNLGLSKRRVLSVETFLTDKGVSRESLKIEYFGESKPKFDNSTEEGRVKNRRVEIHQEENGE